MDRLNESLLEQAFTNAEHRLTIKVIPILERIDQEFAASQRGQALRIVREEINKLMEGQQAG